MREGRPHRPNRTTAACVTELCEFLLRAGDLRLAPLHRGGALGESLLELCGAFRLVDEAKYLLPPTVEVVAGGEERRYRGRSCLVQRGGSLLLNNRRPFGLQFERGQ
ncbi:hypothetical protein [Streptomyces sp. NPDC056817]|uniref:hypothetical protein n=1 Tax=Streptomyces sp. NPDC056817 TaxID=3345950 RepID=UPI0036C7E89C